MPKPKIVKKSKKRPKEIKKTAPPAPVEVKCPDAQITVFAEDLNKLIESDASFNYLKERISKLGQIEDYKTITQFFRIIALGLQDKLAKIKNIPSADNESIKKIEQMKKLINSKNMEIEKLNKNIEGFKEEFVKLRNKLENTGEEAVSSVKKKIFLAFLPALDNFALAVKAKGENADLKTICDGYVMIYEQLKKILEKEGLKEASYIGEKFDPNFQEVIQQVEDSTKQTGCIIEEARKAYFYEDKLIRPAMVKIVK